MWRRLFAALFDLIVLALLSASLTLAFPLPLEDKAASDFLSFLQLCIWFGYFVASDFYYGGTLGKRMLGLRVALPHTETQEIVFFLFLRALMRMVSLALSIPYGLFVIWHPTGRTLTDFVSHGWVIDFSTQVPPKRASLVSRIAATLICLLSPLLALSFLVLVFAGMFFVVWLWLIRMLPL